MYFESSLSLEPMSLKEGADTFVTNISSASRSAHFLPLVPYHSLKDLEQAMEEIHKLRAQLSRIVQANFDNVDAEFSPKMAPPNNTQVRHGDPIAPPVRTDGCS